MNSKSYKLGLTRDYSGRDMPHSKAVRAYQIIANLIIQANLEPDDMDGALSLLESKYSRYDDYLYANNQFNSGRAA